MALKAPVFSDGVLLRPVSAVTRGSLWLGVAAAAGVIAVGSALALITAWFYPGSALVVIGSLAVLLGLCYCLLRWPLMSALSLLMLATSLNAVWWNVGVRVRPDIVFGMLALALLVWHAATRRESSLPTLNARSFAYYGLFIICAGLSMLFAYDRLFALKVIADYIVGYGILLLVCFMLGDKQQLRVAIWLWLAFGLLNAALAFVQLWGYLDQGRDILLDIATRVARSGYPYGMDRTLRARAFWGDANNYGAYLLCSLPLLLSVTIDAWRGKRRGRRWLYFACVIGVSGLLLSWSRSATLGLTLAVAVLIIFWRRQLSTARWLHVAFGVLAVAIVLVGVIWSVPYLREAAVSRLTLQRELSQEGRYGLYGIAMDVFLGSPILGVGLGSFGFVFARDYGGDVGWGVHSFFLQLLTDTGILGFSAYVLWYGLLMRYSYQCTRRHNRASQVFGIGLFATQVGLLIPNLFYGNLGYSCAYVLQALVLSTHRLLTDPPAAGAVG